MFDKNRNKKFGLCLMVVMASLVLATILAVLATPETALADPPDNKGPKGPKEPKEPKHQNTPICVEFNDAFVWDNGAIARIRSDDGRIYCDGEGSGKSKTSTFLGRRDPGGEFVLKTNNTKGHGRSLILDFTLPFEELIECIDRPPLSDIVYPVKVRMLTGRPDAGPDLRTMEVGDTAWASMVIEFYLSGDDTPQGDGDVQQWQLWFGEKFEWWSTTNSDCNPCNQVRNGVWVTCTALNTWTIEALPDTVACLESFVDWSTNIQYRGSFSMPFTLTVTLIED